jgi:hypothetical protein
MAILIYLASKLDCATCWLKSRSAWPATGLSIASSLSVRGGSAVRPESRRLGCTPARPLALEKIDDTVIKVIARVHDLHLALMFKVLDDLAARQNLLRA